MTRAALEYRWYIAGLRIFGNIQDFETITQKLGLSPDHTHRRGERRTRSAQPYRHDAWQIKACVPRERELKHHLLWIYRRLHKKTAALRVLAQQHDVDLYCSYQSDYDQGQLEFPPEILAWCGRIGIPLHVSISVQD